MVYQRARFVGDHTSGLYINRFRVGVRGGATSTGEPVVHATEAKPLVEISPNPFRSSIRIDLSGVACHDAKASVYDLGGRLIDELDVVTTTGGGSRFIWDGSNESGARLPSGVYFCKINCGGAEISRKIVRLR